MAKAEEEEEEEEEGSDLKREVEKDGNDDDVPSSYDMLVNLIDHFNLDSIMQYLTGAKEEKTDVEGGEKSVERMKEVAPVFKSAKNDEDFRTATERAPKGSSWSDGPATVAAPIATTERSSSSEQTTSRTSESVQVVLPVGWTTPEATTASSTYPTRKYTNIRRTTIHPASTSR